jgi:hypothetical protein
MSLTPTTQPIQATKRTVSVKQQIAAFLKSEELRKLFEKQAVNGASKNVVSIELGSVQVPVETIIIKSSDKKDIIVMTDQRHAGWLLKLAVDQFGETQVFDELAKIARECGVRRGYLTCLDLIKSREKIQRIQIVIDKSQFSERVFADIELPVTMADLLVNAKKMSPKKKTSPPKKEEPTKASLKGNPFALLAE